MIRPNPQRRDPLEGRKPDIDYPCMWDYRIIGADEDRMREAVAEIVDTDEYVLTLANRSRKGRYCSLQLTLVVQDEAHRVGLFHELKQRDEVRYVL